jgi:hypothetical protein
MLTECPGIKAGAFYPELAQVGKAVKAVVIEPRQCFQDGALHGCCPHFISNANTRFQSSFMLSTVQPRALASSKRLSRRPVLDWRS